MNLLHDQTWRTSHGSHLQMCLKRCSAFGCDVIGREKGSIRVHLVAGEAFSIAVVLCETVHLNRIV